MEGEKVSGERWKAVFVGQYPDSWSLRCAVGKAILAGEVPWECVVTHCDYGYGNWVDTLLRDPIERMRCFEELREKASGCEAGALRCALLLDMNTREGILIHKFDGWRYSFWPIIDKAQVRREQEARLQLRNVAEELADVPLFLPEGIPAGKKDGKTLLLRLLDE